MTTTKIEKSTKKEISIEKLKRENHWPSELLQEKVAYLKAKKVPIEAIIFVLVQTYGKFWGTVRRTDYYSRDVLKNTKRERIEKWLEKAGCSHVIAQAVQQLVRPIWAKRNISKKQRSAIEEAALKLMPKEKKKSSTVAKSKQKTALKSNKLIVSDSVQKTLSTTKIDSSTIARSTKKSLSDTKKKFTTIKIATQKVTPSTKGKRTVLKTGTQKGAPERIKKRITIKARSQKV